MENKIIHFVFNEDDPQDKHSPFSKQILIKALPCWLVIDMPGFLACLNTLPDNYKITVWVHLQASQKNSVDYYAGEETASQLKAKFGDKLYFEYITRAHPTPSVHSKDAIGVIHINDFSEKIHDSKYHHTVADILNNDKRDKDLVFISHSSEDKTICDKLVGLLVNGFAIPRSKIIYTSGKGTGIPTSGNIPSELQKNIANVGLFISVFTENYLKSSISLAELNAVKLFPNFNNKNIVILKSDEMKHKETGMLNEHDIILDLSNKSHYYKIFDDCKTFLNRYPIKIEKLHEELESYFKE